MRSSPNNLPLTTADKADSKETNIPLNANPEFKEDKAFSFAYFAPGIQNEILKFVGEDVSIKTVSSSYPHDGLKLFNNVQKIFPLSAVADHHVLFGGEPAELKTMIENHPHLLSCTTEAVDPAGRKIKGTLYQKALGAGDFEMAAMLREFLTPEEEDKQYREQFPKDWEKQAAEKLAANEKALDDVWNAIKEAKGSDLGDRDAKIEALKIECKPAIDKFKKHLLSENITTGYHFDLQFLFVAAQRLEHKINEIGGWFSPKEYLFWQQVFGSMQLRASARDQHEHIRGLYHFDEKKPAPRTLKFADGSSIYERSSKGLLVGENSCINISGPWWTRAAGRAMGTRLYQNLCRAKTTALRNLRGNQAIGKRITAR